MEDKKKNVEKVIVDLGPAMVVDMWQMLVKIGFCTSLSASKRAIESGAVKIFNDNTEQWELIGFISPRETIVGNLKSGIIRFGKKKYAKIVFPQKDMTRQFVCWEEDEDETPES